MHNDKRLLGQASLLNNSACKVNLYLRCLSPAFRAAPQVYGVEEKIEFLCGDFFKLAPSIKVWLGAPLHT